MSLISIVIPTRDRPKLLLETLHYVLRQCEVELEILVVDDGSTDPMAEAVLELSDSRVRVLRNDIAMGVSAARNRGLEAAQGEWVAFLDDDDLWAPDKLKMQVTAAREGKLEWAYGGAVAINHLHEIIAGSMPPPADQVMEQLPYRNIVPAGASNVVAAKSLLSKVGAFDTTLRHMADWDLWIRLAQRGPPAVVTYPVVAYRIHEGNASNDIEEIPDELAVLDRRYADLRGGTSSDRAYVYRWMAWNSLRAGRRSVAFGAYLRAAGAGDLLSLVRAVAGVIRPSLAQGRLGRHIHDPGWAYQAEDWVGPPARQ
jgi:glycosyltransferase involved in cell wall biosynthesis